MLVIILLAASIKVSFSSNDVTVNFDMFTSDLANLVKTKHFVDKTDIIKVFFQATPVIMITAPRRFGKSTIMDMIKRFCEVDVDKNGNRIPVDLTENYKLFATNNLNIYKDREFFVNHFGKYPIIYLDFKSLNCDSYEKFLSSFKKMISREFADYYYLLRSSILNELQIVMLDSFYNKIKNDKLGETDLLDSLSFLSELLFTHFNKTRCIVLIDEYDAPIQEAIFDSGTDLIKIIDFTREFISITLKSNSYVGRALINACVRLGGYISTDANNIKHIPFLENDTFSTFYGFTEEEEVKLLLEKLKMSHMMDNVKEWYDGYHVENSSIKIYNPFSIVNYLESKIFENYWVKSGDVKNIQKIFLNTKISRKIDELLEEFTAITQIDRTDIEHIVKLKELVNNPQSCELSENDADLFMQFMTDLGYFNIVHRVHKKIIVRIPNLEIKKEIESVLYSVPFFKEKLNTNSKNINSYVNALVELGEKETTFLSLANSVVNLHANLTKMPENGRHFRHALCTFPQFSGKFRWVNSKITTLNKKRLDLLIIKYDLTAIIIELKYEKLSGYQALKQTINNRYYDILDQKYTYLDIKNYILLGLYFNKNKRCDISYLVNSTDIRNANNVTAFHI